VNASDICANRKQPLLKEKRELQERISQATRYTRWAVIGLIAGIVLITLGLITPFPAFFIIGYTAFIVCTGISSFLTVLKWQYGRALKKEIAPARKLPSMEICPRCGTEVEKNVKYCPKCGKMIQTKKN
jgi:predicted RNA-binding Zn-ribbon protein involved in translation (DUF1610 family)